MDACDMDTFWRYLFLAICIPFLLGNQLEDCCLPRQKSLPLQKLEAESQVANITWTWTSKCCQMFCRFFLFVFWSRVAVHEVSLEKRDMVSLVVRVMLKWKTVKAPEPRRFNIDYCEAWLLGSSSIRRGNFCSTVLQFSSVGSAIWIFGSRSLCENFAREKKPSETTGFLLGGGSFCLSCSGDPVSWESLDGYQTRWTLDTRNNKLYKRSSTIPINMCSCLRRVYISGVKTFRRSET